MAELTLTNGADAVAPLKRDLDPAAFSDQQPHPLSGDFAWSLYGAINQETGAHEIAPFAICDGDTVLLLGNATCNDDAISMFGLPLPLSVSADLGKKRRKKVFQMAFDHMASIAARTGARRAVILGTPKDHALGPVDLACIDRLAEAKVHMHAIADVRDGEKSLHKDLRSSYRSLVNWGRERLDMVYVNSDNPDRRSFDTFPDFHAAIAGGAKRSAGYWDAYWNEIADGRGELSLGYLDDGSLASGSIVVDAGETAYYASGVYDRSKFDKPLAHFPVFDSMVRAGGRGMSVYDLGEIFPAGTVSDKETQIGFFKKGFTATFQLRTVWHVPLGSD